MESSSLEHLRSASPACLSGPPCGALAALEGFEDLGYSVSWEVLKSSDYGVPQYRGRLFIIALMAGSSAVPRPDP